MTSDERARSGPFFNTPERILRLNLAAERWRGTPWRANSMAAGVGVSCHNLPRALYMESQFAEMPQIVSTPAVATATNEMETFLDARPEFERVRSAERGLRNKLLPGDLLGLFIPMDNVGRRLRQRVVNHLGVFLGNQKSEIKNQGSEGWFVHTLMKKNTDVDLITVPPWSQILVAAWRPVEKPTEANEGNEE